MKFFILIGLAFLLKSTEVFCQGFCPQLTLSDFDLKGNIKSIHTKSFVINKDTIPFSEYLDGCSEYLFAENGNILKIWQNTLCKIPVLLDYTWLNDTLIVMEFKEGCVAANANKYVIMNGKNQVQLYETRNFRLTKDFNPGVLKNSVWRIFAKDANGNVNKISVYERTKKDIIENSICIITRNTAGDTITSYFEHSLDEEWKVLDIYIYNKERLVKKKSIMPFNIEETHYLYNGPGLQRETITEITKDSTQTKTYNYTYQWDKTGNWISKTIKSNNGDYLIKREIIYY